LLLGLGCLVSLLSSQPLHASSPGAWATHRLEVVAKCRQASGLLNARLIGTLVEFDDSIGATAALIGGTHPQAHRAGQTGRSLCLFDRRSRTAQAAPADDWR
jgi:hypothetical protein